MPGLISLFTGACSVSELSIDLNIYAKPAKSQTVFKVPGPDESGWLQGPCVFTGFIPCNGLKRRPASDFRTELLAREQEGTREIEGS